MTVTGNSVASEAASPDLAPLFRANRSIRLRPAEDSDAAFLWALFSADEIAHRWIYRGRVPTMEVIRAGLQRPDILAHIVETVADKRPVGYLAAFDVSDRNGHAQLGVVMTPQHLKSGLGATATMLFADYLFTVLPLRKVYLQTIAYNLPQFGKLVDRGYAVSEGVLREHEYFAGRYWDVHVLSVSREQFARLRTNVRLHER